MKSNKEEVSHTNNKDELPSLVRSFGDNVKPWINIIDQLRSKGVDEHVSLPTIAVMGDQSSGKSSVLEAVTGVCLPRGNDIVTRCPLELKMESSRGPWIARLSYKLKTSNNLPVQKELKDPEKVADAILEAQKVIAGDKDDVRPDLISLHVKASDAPDLTVIDLPGIVHTRKRSQGENIIQCINNLLESYMKKEDTIILAVLPANNDLATNAVLEMAKKHDPNAERTIAVITKTDTVYENSSKEKLCKTVQDENLHNINQYFFVRNRTNDELSKKVPLSIAIKNEAEFFQRDPVYSRLPKHFLGIPNLTAALTVRLVDAIKDRFPHIENEVNKQLNNTMNELQALPPSTPDNDVGRILYYTTAVNEFMTKLQTALTHGQVAYYWKSVETQLSKRFDQLDASEFALLNNLIAEDKSNFATIYSRWRDIYEGYSQELRQVTDKHIKNQKIKHQQTLCDMRGSELPTFLNYEVFRNLVLQFLAFYKPIARKCFARMEENLKAMLLCYVKEHLRLNIILQKPILLIASETLRKISKETQEKIDFLFLAEESIYTSDVLFMENFEHKILTQTQVIHRDPSLPSPAKSMFSSFGSVPVLSSAVEYPATSNTTSTKASDLVNMLFDNLNCYLNIVVSRLSDNLPALLMASLHKLFHQKLHQELLSPERNSQVMKYLSKPDPLHRTRENLLKKVKSLKDGVELLRTFTERNIDT